MKVITTRTRCNTCGKIVDALTFYSLTSKTMEHVRKYHSPSHTTIFPHFTGYYKMSGEDQIAYFRWGNSVSQN